MTTEALLDPLLELISGSVKTMQAELKKANLPEPWLSKPDFHPWDVDSPPITYWNSRRDLLAALGMMTAVVQNPKERIVCDSTSYQYPAALNLMCKAKIPELISKLSTDETQGVPVEKLAEEAGINPVKLDRMMRFLSGHHIFEERSPACYANNRISRALQPDCDASSFPITWSGAFSSAAPLFPSVLLNPVTKDSFEPTASAFSIARRKNQNQDPFDKNVETTVMFDYLNQPGNKDILDSFYRGMGALDNINGKGGWLDFDWSKFDKQGGVVCDIGSGAGHLAVHILPAFKHSVIKNLDLPQVCTQGEEFVGAHAPEALKSGKISFAPFDFFKEEVPVKGANAYILGNVIHDWDKGKSLHILNNVKAAMTSESRLLILELIVAPFIPQHGPAANSAAGGTLSEKPPYPLLSEWGLASRYPMLQCIELLAVMNAVDRTWAEYTEIFEEAGFDIVKVHRIRKFISIIELKKKD